MFLFFSKFSSITYWGNFILRTLPLSALFSFFKIFPSFWGIYISRTLRLSRTLVRFGKERLFLYHTKVSHSTTLKCILIHFPQISNSVNIFHLCQNFPCILMANKCSRTNILLPYFTCKNMANYFIAGEVTATISSNNLPFRTPYITPIVTT